MLIGSQKELKQASVWCQKLGLQGVESAVSDAALILFNEFDFNMSEVFFLEGAVTEEILQEVNAEKSNQSVGAKTDKIRKKYFEQLQMSRDRFWSDSDVTEADIAYARTKERQKENSSNKQISLRLPSHLIPVCNNLAADAKIDRNAWIVQAITEKIRKNKKI